MTPLAHSPHAHAQVSVGQVMATVMLALTPATLFGFWLYGWPAINVWLVSLGVALLAESVTLRIMGRPIKAALMDGSALLTAWLLALSLPPWAPWWLAAVGSLFAIVIAKQIFGGLGQNLFNPAMAARVMLLISFPLEMTSWIGAVPITSLAAPGFVDGLAITFAGTAPADGISSATLLGQVKTDLGRGIGLDQILAGLYHPDAMAWGQRAGSLGETSALLLLAGGGVLIWRRIITWHIPVAMLAGVVVPAFLASLIDPAHAPGPLYHLLSGGVILGAFFIATDPVSSPNAASGQLVFGLGCGLLTWIIRTWGGYPEGVAFAVMLMNAATPVIDRYLKPRIYGRDRKGVALTPAKESGK
ncbi:MAG: RnfABCDGE type electron transport complex subunit D [Hydrogenophilales bacterium]|nr:RnfABCDGE type electron transport complex subunit D [Hydrogenophilales bacterium]